MERNIDLYPKISVFLPTYNHEAFIAEAIDSVLLQQYPNIEIVIGDDFSTDDTRKIITEYSKNYPDKFKLILHPQNVGITANCNAILQQCDGDFIALFSGDDVWMPGKLHAQLEWFKNNPGGVLCFSETDVIDENGQIIRRAYQAGEKLIKENIIRAIHVLGENGPGFVIRKSAVPARGFPREITIFSDWYFWVAVAFQGTVGKLDKVYTKYRKHGNSTSTRNINIVEVEHLECLMILKEDFLKYKELIDEEIKLRIWEIMRINKINYLEDYRLKEVFKVAKTKIFQRLGSIFR